MWCVCMCVCVWCVYAFVWCVYVCVVCVCVCGVRACACAISFTEKKKIPLLSGGKCAPHATSLILCLKE